VQGWRIEISVGYDDLWSYWDHKDAIHKITVSADKTPAQIARDIERRLLPHYEHRFRAALERRKAREREIMDRWATVREIAEIIHGDVTRDDRSESPQAWAHFGDYERAEFKADYKGSVDIELQHVPMDTAKWIARIVWLKLIRNAPKENNDERDQDTDLALQNVE
jgi:hypothetical protein